MGLPVGLPKTFESKKLLEARRCVAGGGDRGEEKWVEASRRIY